MCHGVEYTMTYDSFEIHHKNVLIKRGQQAHWLKLNLYDSSHGRNRDQASSADGGST